MQRIGAVQRGRPYADEDLVRAGNRVCDVPDLEDFRSAGGVEDDGLHGGPSEFRASARRTAYAPLKLALRFSTKAVTPSAKSGVPIDRVMDRASL